MAMETFNSVENNEINESLFWFRQELKSLKKLIKSQLSARDLNNENDETDPKIIKLKNTDCQLVDRWSNLELKVVKPWDEGKYWLIIKIENWKFVFYAKHEWKYSGAMFDELRNSYDDFVMTDDDNINKVNLYLRSIGLDLINDPEDIDKLKQLFSRFDKTE